MATSVIQGESKAPLHLCMNGATLCWKSEGLVQEFFEVAYVTFVTCQWRSLSTLAVYSFTVTPISNYILLPTEAQELLAHPVE
jgi:hypothetical protein